MTIPNTRSLDPGSHGACCWDGIFEDSIVDLGIDTNWLVVEPTHLKYISQIGSFPQIGMKIKKKHETHHRVVIWDDLYRSEDSSTYGLDMGTANHLFWKKTWGHLDLSTCKQAWNVKTPPVKTMDLMLAGVDAT